MGFGRMTALSAVTALVGASGLYATAAPAAGQERRVIIERDGDGPGLVIVKDGQDDAQDKGGKRVIVRKIQGGDGPSFDIFGMGGSRVGMVVRDVEAADVTKEKLAGTAGAVVTEVVKESAAEKAGVKAGDVVTSFDGERVRSARQLERLVEETPAGRTVKVALQRAGAPVTLDVTPQAPKMAQVMPGMPGEGGDVFSYKRAPGQGPEWEGSPGMPFKFEMPAGRFDFEGEPFLAASRGRLGVRVQDLSEELASYFGVKSGVLVAGVEADAPAAKAGIKAGDVITAVNGQAITEPGELRREVAKVEDGKTADLSVTRDKKPLTLKVEVTARDPGGRTQDAPLAVDCRRRAPQARRGPPLERSAAFATLGASRRLPRAAARSDRRSGRRRAPACRWSPPPARAAPAPITISGPSTSAGRGSTASRPASCAAKIRVSASVAGCRSLPGGSSIVTTPETPPAVTIGTTRAPGASLVPRTERASPRVNAVATGVSLESGIVPIRPIVVDA